MNCGLPAPLKSAATPREATCQVTTAHVLFLLLRGEGPPEETGLKTGGYC